MEDRTQDLLDIYKLHAELADRVSQRREGANRLYVSLLVGLAVFAAAILRFSTDSISVDTVLIWTSILGAMLTLSWYVTIRSYRQLNAGKFRVLQDLERHLAYPFFTKEWEVLTEGQSRRIYWKLTVVETALPCLLFLLFLGLAFFAAIP